MLHPLHHRNGKEYLRWVDWVRCYHVFWTVSGWRQKHRKSGAPMSSCNCSCPNPMLPTRRNQKAQTGRKSCERHNETFGRIGGYQNRLAIDSIRETCLLRKVAFALVDYLEMSNSFFWQIRRKGVLTSLMPSDISNGPLLAAAADKANATSPASILPQDQR